MKQKELNSLNSLRFIFIIFVVIYHVGDCFGKPFHFLEPIYQFGGYLCNYFFFMLSGFLAAYIYNQKIADDKISFLEYMKKKIKKYYPLYIITNCFMLFHNILVFGVNNQLQMKSFIYTVLMISSGWIEDIYPYNISCWFICVLLLCHIIFYFLAQVRKKNMNFYYLFLIVLICLGYILEMNNFSFPFCYVHDGEGIFNFFTGVLLTEIYYVLKEKMANIKITNLISIFCIALSIAVIFLAKEYGVDSIMGDIRFVITAFFMPILFFVAIFFKPLTSLLELPLLSKLGNISMVVYFMHLPIYTIYNDVTSRLDFINNEKIKMIIYILITFISSYLISSLMEFIKNRKAAKKT